MDYWDPLVMDHVAEGHLSPQSSYRLKKDISDFMKEPLDGILLEPDESRFLRVHALIKGVAGTPYEGGFFYFVLGFPSDYPYSPPRVKLMTTGCGTVRFNPNLYSSGKVCLSILGTFAGPSWSATLGLKSVLLSIQSLMNEKPYHNEPGFETERTCGDIGKYNDMLRHETIRVAVIAMVTNNTHLAIPERFQKYMKEYFLANYKSYEGTIVENITLDGMIIEDPLYNTVQGKYQYCHLWDAMEQLQTSLLSNQDSTF